MKEHKQMGCCGDCANCPHCEHKKGVQKEQNSKTDVSLFDIEKK